MLQSQLFWDIFMYIGLSIVGWTLYCVIMDKPVLPAKVIDRWKKKKKNKDNYHDKREDIELKISMQELLGIIQFRGDMVELKDKKGIRKFVGMVKCEPINYLLRSGEEQAETDNAYEHMIASLTLGPGREVEFATSVSSRPIDLGDQLEPYEQAFPQLDPIAQRFAQDMFFPFLKQWQQTVDEYDYQRYIPIIIRYTEKMIEDLDEESVLVKARNEFGRLSTNVRSNYKRMGGRAKICTGYDLYEALYFSLNKKNGSMSHFRTLMQKEGVLSPFVCSDYSREAYRYIEEDAKEDGKNAS